MLSHVQKKTAAVGVLAVSLVLLGGCDHRLEQAQARQDVVNHNEASNQQALSLSEAASAAPYTQAVSRPHGIHSALSARSHEIAGRYTGVIHCKQDSNGCSQGNIDVTLTLFADGSGMRTLMQQGLVNSMLERETAFWQLAKDGEHVLVYLPDEVLKFTIKAHQLTLQDVGHMKQSDDSFGVVFSVDEPDHKQDAYTLTRQANA